MSNLKLVLSFSIIGFFGAISLDANADSEGSSNSGGYAYLGGGAGYGRMNGEDFTNANNDLTKSRVSWKAIAGVKLNNMLSVEGQYLDFGATNKDTDNIKATGFTAGIVLDLLKGKPVSPYVKAGALFWDTDSRFSNISRQQDGSDLTFGLGVRFMVSDHLALRTEYERFTMDTTDIDNLSVSLLFNF